MSGLLDTTEYIRVINNAGFDIKGRYDGVDYLFKVGVPTDVHVTIAKHVFDFGKTDKTTCFLRFGWVEKFGSYEAAEDVLNKITFDEVPQPAVDISPAKRGRPRISKPTPLVNAGADDGEGDDPSPSDALEAVGDL
jgi:hypothetical protein